MNMKASLMAFLIIAFIAAVPAQAYSEASIDVKLANGTLCPCSTLTSDDVSVTVKNTGTSTETYQLELELPDEGSWSGFISPSMKLSPGEEGKATVFITPSCGVEPGKYDITVVAKSPASDKSFTQDFTLEVMKCHWIDIVAKDYELCQGIESKKKITITNGGVSSETVIIKSSAPWVTPAVNQTEIKRGDKKEIELLFSPGKDIAGMQDVKLTVESVTSYAKNEQTLKVNVLKCYSSDIKIEPLRQQVCPCQTADFTLTVENTGLKEDEFLVTFENQSSRMSISAGDSGKFSFSVNIPCDRKAGNYTIPVKVDSSTLHKANPTITVLPSSLCYGVGLSSDYTRATVGVGSGMVYKFTVKNKGKFAQAYDLQLDAPEWVHLSESRVELPAGEQVDVYIYAAPYYYTDQGNYTAKVTAVTETEKSSIDFMLNVKSDYTFDRITDNVSMNISIPTGGVVGAETGTSQAQILMISILAIGVVVILILRFVIMMK